MNTINRSRVSFVLFRKLRSLLLVIFGIFSNLLGIKNPIHHEGRRVFAFHFLNIKNKFFYILVEDGKTRAITTELPVMIEIYPSLKCNLSCRYCDRGKEDSMLQDFNDIKVLFNNLKKNASFHLLHFRISGGEPTIYTKVNELISFLRSIDPYANIDFITNVIKLKRLTKESLENINIITSIYPYTEERLKKDEYIASFFKSSEKQLNAGVLFHEDMDCYGAIRNDFVPLLNCFVPTLVCGTKQVYPCCRAHRLEQMYHKNYHLDIYASNLYKNLKKIIKNTDLCVHCPRVYTDCTKISLFTNTARPIK